MQTLKKRLKNRAFILIGTLILIVFILGNFLLGYRIIYRKGERLNSYFSTISIDSKVHNLQTLAYDELKRIDKEISSGNYQSGAEYIGFEENFNRVWLGNSKNSYSFNRYLLYRIRFNGKTCYKYGDGDNKNFKEIILVNLYSYPYTNNIVTIEIKKTLTNPKANNQVSLLAKVDIEYEKGNKNPLTPNSEKLRSLWSILKIVWLNKFLKKEKLNFFTLEEIENYKNGILLLESNFFHLIPLTLSKDIDEREREFEITEKLENIFDEYDSFYFLDKEIILEEDEEKEKTLLILIEKDKIYTLLDNLKDKKTDLLGIYPLFLIELFNKDNLEKTYIEVENDKYRLYYFLENKLINFLEVDFEKEEIVNNSTYLEENLKGESFVYPNQNDIIEYLSFLKIREWKNYPLEFRKDFNFLPTDYIKERNYKKNIKISIFFISLTIIISTIIFFSIYFLIEKEQERLNILENSYSTYHEKNLQIREEILKIEEEIKKLKEKNRIKDFNKMKLSQLIKTIYNNENLEITSIEYGDGMFTLQGITDFEEDIYKFQNRLLNYRFFKNFNHDFIKLNNNRYEFHIDIEVEDEITEEN